MLKIASDLISIIKNIRYRTSLLWCHIQITTPTRSSIVENFDSIIDPLKCDVVIYCPDDACDIKKSIKSSIERGHINSHKLHEWVWRKDIKSYSKLSAMWCVAGKLSRLLTEKKENFVITFNQWEMQTIIGFWRKWGKSINNKKSEFEMEV